MVMTPEQHGVLAKSPQAWLLYTDTTNAENLGQFVAELVLFWSSGKTPRGFELDLVIHMLILAIVFVLLLSGSGGYYGIVAGPRLVGNGWGTVL
jgi:hypothetical protein